MENLEQIINKSHLISDIIDIPTEIQGYLSIIGENCKKRKGVYTVLTTLLYYKYRHPQQDIRQHQRQLPNGFSGRSFDTQEVTPILNRCGLPSMAESGWLTRSLEQPYPYDFNYNGKIPTELKSPFLHILDYVEKNPSSAYNLLKYLMSRVIQTNRTTQIIITPLQKRDNITITEIMQALQEHFAENYKTHNGAKLPVLAFHAIYSALILELKRYENCVLKPLSSLTACDRTNKAAGDIEIFQNGKLYEAIEIKLDKQIDEQIVRVAQEKIIIWNPQRYYILSVNGIKESDEIIIQNTIQNVRDQHGCQIIINGLLPTLKYYLRLITDLNQFTDCYSTAIKNDTELQAIHKEMWNTLIDKYNL